MTTGRGEAVRVSYHYGPGWDTRSHIPFSELGL